MFSWGSFLIGLGVSVALEGIFIVSWALWKIYKEANKRDIRLGDAEINLEIFRKNDRDIPLDLTYNPFAIDEHFHVPTRVSGSL